MVLPSALTPPFWVEGTSTAKRGIRSPFSFTSVMPSTTKMSTSPRTVWLPSAQLSCSGSCHTAIVTVPPFLGVPAEGVLAADVTPAGAVFWAAGVLPTGCTVEAEGVAFGAQADNNHSASPRTIQMLFLTV